VLADWQNVSDEELVRLIRAGDAALYEVLMRRYNQRTYRVVLTILRNDAEAEDVMQEAYVSAYDYIGGALCYGRKSNAALVLLPPLSFHSTYPGVIESLKAYSGDWSGITRAGHRRVRRPFCGTPWHRLKSRNAQHQFAVLDAR
jgi:hypothetical protein